ncbi:hypothetical protein So717_08830 [Roseobacter cerasinus]|uniref:Pyruvate/2-oxoglutarate dehydrogenase complex, dihydrolipoamide acyltransferase (E2) component n=1 Tax=Roseobacter cerasinus TaxID=2602289 RepID=A0A640VNY0_9RHOB|nr:DUF3035 domain-containing protein [Roseobacter cerasinus]GFE49130.1 hypothetical protein So717_08830 [Roseobacter cerasinus]
MRRIVALALITACVGACVNTGLRDLQSNSRGPDEFIIEPKAPLQTPDDLSALPTPTPGQSNLTDNDPLGDAVVALGGRTSDAAGIPASDGALVTAASRFGVAPDIRADLAAEDERFRKRQARFSQIRLFREDRYLEAYSRERLDANKTAERWRRAGARTPSYPPN